MKEKAHLTETVVILFKGVIVVSLFEPVLENVLPDKVYIQVDLVLVI